MTPRQIDGILEEMRALRGDFREFGDRLHALELWRARLEGARMALSVPGAIVAAVCASVVSSVITAVIVERVG